MCDPTLLTAGIVIAMGGVIGAIAFIGAAIIANNSFFGAPGAPVLMIAAGVSTGVAIGGLVLISSQVNSYFNCMNSPEECSGVYTNLLNLVNALITVLSFQATACFVAAGIAWIPWAGSAPMYVILATLILQVALIASFYVFITDFYYCLEDVKENTPVGGIVTGTVAAAVVISAVTEVVRRRIKKK